MLRGSGLFWGSVVASSLAAGCASSTPSSAKAPQEQVGSTARSVAGAEQASEEGLAGVAQRPEVSGPVPADFELEGLDGNSFRLGEELGKSVILIDFWATYCDPCLAAMPHLNELFTKYRSEGLMVIGVSIDGPESVAQVRTEVAKLGVRFPILLDSDSEVVALYNPKTSAPFSVLIDRSGRIVSQREGYTTAGGEQLEADIRQALAQ